MTDRIDKTTLAANLDAALGASVGMRGLAILLYGWTRRDPQLRVNISHRSWLYLAEAEALSEYAGYNLLKMPSDSICE